jgi:hypothetical protein
LEKILGFTKLMVTKSRFAAIRDKMLLLYDIGNQVCSSLRQG